MITPSEFVENIRYRRGVPTSFYWGLLGGFVAFLICFMVVGYIVATTDALRGRQGPKGDTGVGLPGQRGRDGRDAIIRLQYPNGDVSRWEALNTLILVNGHLLTMQEYEEMKR